MLGELQQPDIEFDGLQEIISRDVGLSYNLLRFINSAFFSLPRRVESIRDALVLLGVMNVRKWATLMALADADDKPQEIVVTALVRARMCESARPRPTTIATPRASSPPASSRSSTR